MPVQRRPHWAMAGKGTTPMLLVHELGGSLHGLDGLLPCSRPSTGYCASTSAAPWLGKGTQWILDRGAGYCWSCRIS